MTGHRSPSRVAADAVVGRRGARDDASKLEIPKFQIPIRNPGPQRSLQTVHYAWQIPKFLILIPAPKAAKAPKAKSFMIPRIRRLKLQFPYYWTTA